MKIAESQECYDGEHRACKGGCGCWCHHDPHQKPTQSSDSTERPKINMIITSDSLRVDPEKVYPCAHGHRWAYLARGGQACGRCGVRR